MKKLIIAVSVMMSACALVAAEKPAAKPQLTPEEKEAKRKEFKEKLALSQMHNFGGFVNDTRAQRGKLVIVNAQKTAEVAWLKEVADRFAGLVKITAEVTEGSFDLAKPELKGEATVYVVDDPKLPMSLIAPEAKWAMVNVSPLKSDKPVFYTERVKKELTRGVAYLLGAANSTYPNCLLGCVTKAEDLDRYMGTRLPVDVEGKFVKYVPGLGIVPYKRTTYRKSIEEGWGAQPTNDAQKAIWQQVHELPSNPITIKYDPKRDK